MEQQQQPDWLDKAPVASRAAALRPEPPWRTAAAGKPAPAAAPQPQGKAKAKAKTRRTHSVWETHVLPLVFLAVLVLVIGGYLAGWHLG